MPDYKKLNKPLSWFVLLVLAIIFNFLSKYFPILSFIAIICFALAIVAGIKKWKENKSNAPKLPPDNRG